MFIKYIPIIPFIIYNLIFALYVPQNITAGTVCPAAIFVVYTIYNPTNNGGYIKYRTPRPHIFAAIRFSLIAAGHHYFSLKNEIKDFFFAS